MSVEVATLPARWQDRLVRLSNDNTNGATGHCLDPHDLVIAKLVAGRMKDLQFTHALLHAGLIDPDVLLDRAQLLDQPFDAKRVTGWVAGWVQIHGQEGKCD